MNRLAKGLVLWSMLAPMAWGTAALAQAEAFFLRAPKLDVQSVPLGTTGASIELPRRDWRITPTKEGDTVAVAEQRRREATIRVEASTLQLPLRSEDVTDLFGEIESDRLKGQNAQGEGFEMRLFRLGDRRVAVVQFTRPGSSGPEQVRQYSYPDGPVLYRVTCVSAVERFKRYEPVFAHVAATFRGPGQS